MDRTRLFLAANVLIWLPYGLYCLARPDLLHEVAGVAATSATGSTELRAMYGGLQAAIGALALASSLTVLSIWLLRSGGSARSDSAPPRPGAA